MDVGAVSPVQPCRTATTGLAEARRRCAGAAIRARALLTMPAMALALAVLAGAGSAHAADHALLVGVSDYPSLPKRLWLKGPVNDVALMSQTLQSLGFAPERMRSLVSRGGAQASAATRSGTTANANGAAGSSAEPTRQNILQAMQQLLAAVQRGDHVVLYLAGHGSQQPQPTDHGSRPTEADGLDEVFLPADVQRWQGGSSEQAIPNALLDDEIGEWLDAVVDRGATVWAFFDTCHAGGMARGRGARTRAVPPAEFGLPAIRATAAKPVRAAGRTDGRVLAFAGRAHEAAGEEWLPQGAALGSNRMHGVFTFHLAQALTTAPQSTAATLAQAVRAAYARERRVAPTPEFKGDAAITLR